MTTSDSEHIYAAVRDRYAKAARATSNSTCCRPSGTATGLVGPTLYEEDDTDALPTDALAASLGCGNPTVLADLRSGRSFSTSAQAEGSTCCCRHAGSARPAWHMGWT